MKLIGLVLNKFCTFLDICLRSVFFSHFSYFINTVCFLRIEKKIYSIHSPHFLAVFRDFRHIEQATLVRRLWRRSVRRRSAETQQSG